MDGIQSKNRYTPYKVLAQETLGDLEASVEAWMARGYRPIGGVTINDGQTSFWYMQAVVFEGKV